VAYGDHSQPSSIVSAPAEAAKEGTDVPFFVEEIRCRTDSWHALVRSVQAVEEG